MRNAKPGSVILRQNCGQRTADNILVFHSVVPLGNSAWQQELKFEIHFMKRYPVFVLYSEPRRLQKRNANSALISAMYRLRLVVYKCRQSGVDAANTHAETIRGAAVFLGSDWHAGRVWWSAGDSHPGIGCSPPRHRAW
jgi:hypothetical protein